MSSPQDPSALYETTPELISEHAFKVRLIPHNINFGRHLDASGWNSQGERF